MKGIVVHGPGQPRSVYDGDHYKSDRNSHTYYDNCLAQIPDFMIRYCYPLARFGNEYWRFRIL